MRLLVPLILIAKVLAYSAVTVGAALIYPPVAWVVGGGLSWWLIKEEIEPWAALKLKTSRNQETV